MDKNHQANKDSQKEGQTKPATEEKQKKHKGVKDAATSAAEATHNNINMR